MLIDVEVVTTLWRDVVLYIPDCRHNPLEISVDS